MAVLATSNSITLSVVIDIQGFYRYYLLQSSTSAVPTKPTTNPPVGNWTDTEPTYTTGSTNSLYFVDLTVFNNGTFEYSDVSLSSSYEAAKAAYNQAVLAQEGVNDINDTLTLSNTVTGSIVHVTDAAAVPAEEVVVDISPVQDLHGYDRPWPPGGGKNLLNLSGLSYNKLENGITFTYNGDGTVTGNGTATGQCQFYFSIPKEIAATYGGLIYNAGLDTSSSQNQGGSILELAGSPYTQFASASSTTVNSSISSVTANVNLIWRLTSGKTLNNYVWKPMLCDPSAISDTWVPYSNICPISGWTGVNVTRTGKNLFPFPYSDTRTEIAGVTVTTHSDGTITLDGTANAKFYFNYGLLQSAKKFQPGTYTLSGGDNKYRITVVKNSSFFKETSLTSGSVTFTLSEASFLHFYGYAASSTVFSNTTYSAQLELGSTATSYEPYAGDTYSISFHAAVGTVYGGTLDVIKGKLTVDRVIVDLSELGWNQELLNMRSRVTDYTTAVTGWNGDWHNIKSNCLTSIDPATAYANCPTWSFRNIKQNYYNFNVKVPDGMFTDASDFKAWLANIDGSNTHAVIMMPIATSIIYNLTPVQIQILLGENNVWADTGAITLQYCRNTTLYSGVIKQTYDAVHNLTALSASAKGNIVHILDAAAVPAEEVIVDISPVQDLHGYNNPWPAGGGKNVFPITLTTQTQNGTTFTVTDDGNITIANTPSALTRVRLNNLTITPSANMKFSMTGSATGVRVFAKKTSGGTITYPTLSPSLTLSQGDTFDEFYLEVTTSFTGSVTVKMQLENGTSVTSWVPYSNICPISGWMGANVRRTGKNLLPRPYDITKPSVYTSGWTGVSLDGEWVVQTGYGWNKGSWGGVCVYGLKSGTYTLQYDADLTNAVDNQMCITVWIMFTDGTKSDQSTRNMSDTHFSKSYTFEKDVRVAAFRITSKGNSNTSVVKYKNIQLELDSTPTDYEPYTGDTYSVTFPSAEGTVYGGTLDVTKGKLTVNNVCRTFTGQEESYTYGGQNNRTAVYILPSNEYIKYVDNFDNKSNYKSSHFIWAQAYQYTPPYTEIRVCSGNSSSANDRITFINALINQTLAEFKSYLAAEYNAGHPVQVYYELATPITYDLTPVQIQMLLGENNVWADCGDTTLTYSRDTSLFSGVIKQAYDTATSAQEDATQALEDVSAADARAQAAEEVLRKSVDSFAEDVQQLSLELNRTNGVIEGAVMKDDLHAYVRYGITTGNDGTLELGQNDSRYVARVSPENGFQVIIDGTEMSAMRKNTISAPVMAPKRMIQIGDNVIKLSTDGGLIFN